MKSRHVAIAFAIACAACASGAFALPPACEAIVAAYENHEQQPDWQARTTSDGVVLEGRKRAGRQSILPPGGSWMDVPPSAQAAGAALVARLRDEAGTMDDCTLVGRDSIDGIDVTHYRYTQRLLADRNEIISVFVGDDGLLYRQSGDGVVADYRYGKAED